jgi:dihydropyrimidinase
VRVTSTAAAQIFNIYPKKGAIVPGADADLVVWDPAGTRTISAKTHHQNIDFNIFEGMEVVGVPAITLSRGKVVWEDGQLASERGAGRWVDRPCFAPYYDAITAARERSAPRPVKRD